MQETQRPLRPRQNGNRLIKSGCAFGEKKGWWVGEKEAAARCVLDSSPTWRRGRRREERGERDVLQVTSPFLIRRQGSNLPSYLTTGRAVNNENEIPR